MQNHLLKTILGGVVSLVLLYSSSSSARDFESDICVYGGSSGVPLVLLGSRLPTWVAVPLDEYRFNVCIAVLLLASGIALLLK